MRSIFVLIAFLSAGYAPTTVSAQTVPYDTTIATDTGLVETDTVTDAEPLPRGPRKMKIVDRKLDYREQITFAIAMMAFIGIMLGASQNWNP
jgi:hypothetical protein